MLQGQVGQVDLLGQLDGHLAAVTCEGPAVARCHIGLEGQVQWGYVGWGGEDGFLTHPGSPGFPLSYWMSQTPPDYKAWLQCHQLQEAPLIAGSEDESSPQLSAVRAGACQGPEVP